jgi:ribose transport system substrate-binding protein
MAEDHHDREEGLSRRLALASMLLAGPGVLYAVSRNGLKQFSPFNPAEAAFARAQTSPTIPVIVRDTTSFYWQTVLAGARRAGEESNIHILELGAQSESDTGRLVSMLDIAVAANPLAVVIAPMQLAASGKSIKDAAQKTKIIGIDSTVDANSADFTSILSGDDLQAGRIAADILADRIKKTYADAEGDVAQITASPGVSALDGRARGFREQLAARYGALNIVVEKVADGEAATGRRLMEGLISEYSELRGVFASDRAMAHGAAQAIAEKKTNKTGDTINLVGFDWDDELIKELKDGTIAALVVRDPFRLGYESIKTALAASKGEQVPGRIDIPASVITKANISSARSQELLHPGLGQ